MDYLRFVRQSGAKQRVHDDDVALLDGHHLGEGLVGGELYLGGQGRDLEGDATGDEGGVVDGQVEAKLGTRAEQALDGAVLEVLHSQPAGTDIHTLYTQYTHCTHNIHTVHTI